MKDDLILSLKWNMTQIILWIEDNLNLIQMEDEAIQNVVEAIQNVVEAIQNVEEAIQNVAEEIQNVVEAIQIVVEAIHSEQMVQLRFGCVEDGKTANWYNEM